jgi:glycosyltransferase involved in cell wall biosynthesis
MIVNLIQDIPTPHNNILIEKLSHRKDIKLKLWYAEKKNLRVYNWKENLADKYLKSNIYGKNLNLLFIIKCLFTLNQKFILVGWQNTNTKILYILFFLFRKKFNHWTDLPNEKLKNKKKIFNKLIYLVLKKSNAKILCVGKITINFFLNKNFDKKRLLNLPILFDRQKSIIENKKKKRISSVYLKEKDFIVSMGSRLEKIKGFDLALKAINLVINKYHIKNIRLFLIGSGSEKKKLEKFIISNRLRKNVFLIDWMEYQDFVELISLSHLFLHPSRFDAYGSVNLSISQGTATIASRNSGSAKELIKNNINGILYNPFDIRFLSEIIVKLYKSKITRNKFNNFSKIFSKKIDIDYILNNLLKNII